MNDEQRRQRGLGMRRRVLGDAHVDCSLRNLNEFNGAFQDFITRYAWGEIWLRPGLPLHTRSLLTLAMMVALNREEEFKMHVRAAIDNGITRAEIEEVLLQCALYCGLPAANSAFQWSQQVFNSIDTPSNPQSCERKVV